MNTENRPLILFDGVCNYCNSVVNFIIRHDKSQHFIFSPLQSERGQQILESFDLPKKEFNSFILVDNHKICSRSTAALHVLNKLPWYWKWTQIFWIIPVVVRDALYNLIARNRYKWFGKKDSCMIPSPEIKARFLV